MYSNCNGDSPDPVDAYDRYLLRLADGQGWELVGTTGTERWVEKLASIMRLTRCEPNGYPKLVFMRNRPGYGWRDPIYPLGYGGWKFHVLSSLELSVHRDAPDIICKMGDAEDHDLAIARMSLSLSPVYKQALESGGLPLHAALVERNGTGVLLPAAGGTGKSTCCRRVPPPWKPLCDDLTLIVTDTHGRYQAHPFPTWSNYLGNLSETTTWDVQQHFPLSALFFLEQSTTDEIIPVGQGQAAALMTESATQIYGALWTNLGTEEVRMLKEKVFENASELAKTIPVFRLRVTMGGRFWEKMEKVLF